MTSIVSPISQAKLRPMTAPCDGGKTTRYVICWTGLSTKVWPMPLHLFWLATLAHREQVAQEYERLGYEFVVGPADSHKGKGPH